MLQKSRPRKEGAFDVALKLEQTEREREIITPERLQSLCNLLKDGLLRKGGGENIKGAAVQPHMLKMGCSDQPLINNRGKGPKGNECPFQNGGNDGSTKCGGNPCWMKLITAQVWNFYNLECDSAAPAPTPSSGPVTEPQCETLVGASTGSSDGGDQSHGCTWCSQTCAQTNKQRSVYLQWTFDPPLTASNAFDVAHKVEWKHVSRLSEYGKNGLFQAFRFFMAKPATGVKSFSGYTGPQITATTRTHLFSIWDTYNDPTNAERRLALPAADPGHCKRNCNDCGLHPGVYDTTGTQCKLDFQDGHSDASYFYRLRMSNPDASVSYNDVTYSGTEWEVTVTTERESSRETIVVGRMLLQGDASTSGIEVYKSFHEHIGCTSCDAFYEQTIVTGPFILEPQGIHTVTAGSVEPLDSKYLCRLHREVHLGGLKVSLETGPGVDPGVDDTSLTKLFDSCDYTDVDTSGLAQLLSN
jgi:hypothetical protein